MGSSNTTVGNQAGKPLMTFTAAGQDTGSLLYNEATSYSKWGFQLTGTGTGYLITLYGTFDRDTAAGTAASPQWFELPAPSTEAAFQYANPLANAVGQRVMFCNMPMVAVRAVSSAQPGGASGSVTLLAYVSP